MYVCICSWGHVTSWGHVAVENVAGGQGLAPRAKNSSEGVTVNNHPIKKRTGVKTVG